jgi:protoporphyrinogen oxidase
MARLIVIGSGAMGLAAAYHASKAGHSVGVLEAAADPGGMAAHFDFDGLSIERFYHFVCKADRPTFALLNELGIGDRMRWRTTSMGYFTDGQLHPWGDPSRCCAFRGSALFPEFDTGCSHSFRQGGSGGTRSKPSPRVPGSRVGAAAKFMTDCGSRCSI